MGYCVNLREYQDDARKGAIEKCRRHEAAGHKDNRVVTYLSKEDFNYRTTLMEAAPYVVFGMDPRDGPTFKAWGTPGGGNKNTPDLTLPNKDKTECEVKGVFFRGRDLKTSSFQKDHRKFDAYILVWPGRFNEGHMFEVMGWADLTMLKRGYDVHHRRGIQRAVNYRYLMPLNTLYPVSEEAVWLPDSFPGARLPDDIEEKYNALRER